MNVLDSFRLDGRVALVTGGASGGLGRWMAEGLLEAGAAVVITSRTEEHAQSASDLQSDRFAYTTADIRDPASVQALFDFTTNRFGPIDILINNAGASWGEATATVSLEHWERVIDVNLTGTFLCCQRFGQDAIAAKRRGKIINISSIAGLRAGRNPTISYATSKGGLIAFTKQLALEWAPHGITVNAIAPGLFPTKMSKGIIDPGPSGSASRIPLQRLGTPADIKATAVFLASSASDFITGAVLSLDGGAGA